jgi:branched-chain amino acid transport system substrate-binding protein
MKKLLSLLLVLVMVFSMTACSAKPAANDSKTNTNDKQESSDNKQESNNEKQASSNEQESEKKGDSDYSYVVGHYGGITGGVATAGTAGYEAIQLAIDTWNKKGGVLGGQIGFEFYDDGSTTEGAVKGVSYLIDEKKVDGIIASQLSGNIQATGDIVEANQIPEVGTGMNPAWLEQGWTYLFRSLPNNGGGAQPLVDAMVSLNVTKLGAMIYQDDGNISAWNNTKEVLDNTSSIEVTTVEQSVVGESDWTGTLSSILKTEPNGVLIFAQGEQACLMIKQLRDLGYNGYVFGPETFSLPDIRKVAGDGANGVVFFAPHCVPDSPEEANSDAEKEFLQLYVEKYGRMPASDVAYRAWDATNILLTAVEQAGTKDGPTVRDTIKNMKIDLLAGSADFTAYDNGECLSGQQIYVTHGGKNISFSKFIAENAVDTYQP